METTSISQKLKGYALLNKYKIGKPIKTGNGSTTFIFKVTDINKKERKLVTKLSSDTDKI